MSNALQKFKRKAMAKPAVRLAYEALEDEFSYLDELLKARAASGLSQSEVASRIGTSQSAIARLESIHSKHSPSLATLQNYANALGYKVQIKLIPLANQR
jgi:ribosome-binding protein aMBF1 (putative translation factor)